MLYSLLRSMARSLRWSPQFRALARSWYWQIECVKASALGTKYHENQWRRRHLRSESDWNGPGDWVDGYWNSRTHSHRPFLIDHVMSYKPSSVLEFGYNCGPNLYLLYRKDSTLRLTGIDINPAAISRGRDLLLSEACIGVDLKIGGVESLEEIPDASVDVFLTDAVLLYIGPDMIKKVLMNGVRLASRGIVMLEWHYDAVQGSPPERFIQGHWARDYCRMFADLVPPGRVRVIRLPRDLWPGEYWSRFGHVIRVDLRARTAADFLNTHGDSSPGSSCNGGGQ